MTVYSPRFLSTVFGGLMALTAGVHARGVSLIAVALTVAAVLIGIGLRWAATLAVLFAVLAIVLTDPPPVVAALAGLCAVVYLALRHAVGAPMTLTVPTVVGAVGFTMAGVVATLFPAQLPWLPLIAPLAVFAIFALATRPFWRGDDGAANG
jgi:hypothetical protein